MQLERLLVLALAAAWRSRPSARRAPHSKAFREATDQAALNVQRARTPPEIKLADSNDIVEAYVNLGVCRVETGDDSGATGEFERALGSIRTSSSMHRVITNSARSSSSTTPRPSSSQAARARGREDDAAELIEAQRATARASSCREQPYYLNLLPFGSASSRTAIARRASSLAASQGTVASGVAIFVYLVQKYGISSDAGPARRRPGQSDAPADRDRPASRSSAYASA